MTVIRLIILLKWVFRRRFWLAGMTLIEAAVRVFLRIKKRRKLEDQ